MYIYIYIFIQTYIQNLLGEINCSRVMHKKRDVKYIILCSDIRIVLFWSLRACYTMHRSSSCTRGMLHIIYSTCTFTSAYCWIFLLFLPRPPSDLYRLSLNKRSNMQQCNISPHEEMQHFLLGGNVAWVPRFLKY